MFNMIDKTANLTSEQINDLAGIIERNARTAEEADAATAASVRYIGINCLFNSICPMANIALALVAALIATALTHNIFIIIAAALVADAIPAIAYGIAATTQIEAFEKATAARLDRIIATL